MFFLIEPSTASTVKQNVSLCSEAIIMISKFERALETNGIIAHQNTTLAKMERVILDLSASPHVSAGIYYHLSLTG